MEAELIFDQFCKLKEQLLEKLQLIHKFNETVLVDESDVKNELLILMEQMRQATLTAGTLAELLEVNIKSEIEDEKYGDFTIDPHQDKGKRNAAVEDISFNNDYDESMETMENMKYESYDYVVKEEADTECGGQEEEETEKPTIVFIKEEALDITEDKNGNSGSSFDPLESKNQNFGSLTRYGKPRVFSCGSCSKSFSQKSDLNKHQTVHTGEKPHKCDTCGKSFSQKSNLKIHQMIHTEGKAFNCDICDKSFARKSYLKLHEKKHSGELPYSCDMCESAFAHNGALENHKRTHTGEKPYKCEICHKRFSLKCNLNIHVRIHTGERPHKCSLCEKSFIHTGDLKKHLRIHTGEKPYHCEYCPKSFPQKSQLNTHTKVTQLRKQ